MGPSHPSPGVGDRVDTENPEREEEALGPASSSGFRISSE